MRKFSSVPGLFAGLVLLSLPGTLPAGVSLSINIAPPALQVYEQPVCPTDGYLWTPGYWGYRDTGYYWIPGAWMAPPQAGFLWTPGYWGFSGGIYAFNAGYWGPTVGFYGGVNYGFGYGGHGFDGGRWEGGHFAYNTAVSRVNTTVIHNTYEQKVSVNNNRTSFNGGSGIAARPSAAETTMARQHNQPAATQTAENRGSAVNRTAPRPAATHTATHAATTSHAVEAQSRPAARATPASAKPEERQAPAATRASAPHVTQAARPQEHAPAAAARSSAPSRPAPQQPKMQAAHAAAPQRAAPRPAEGKEERR